MASVVYCVVPVHNRKETTKRCLDYLEAQDYQPIHVVIVDDGSTDGTSEYLALRLKSNLTVLHGNGNLWWGGAMRMGMIFVSSLASDEDYLLMLNDDVHIRPDYISGMVSCSRSNNFAVVGSVQRDEKTDEIIGCGYQIDFFAMRFNPLLGVNGKTLIQAFPGRGLLIPFECIKKAGFVNAFLFPHYFGDIEYTARLAEAGFKLTASMDSAVYTSSESSDAGIRMRGDWRRRFSTRSKDNIIQRLVFFSIRGPVLLRLLALPRFILFSLGRIFKIY